MNNEPTIIKGFPGEGVDIHLKKFGHLPTTSLCDTKGSCNPWIHELNWDREKIGKTWCVRCGEHDVKEKEICEWSVKNVNIVSPYGPQL